MKTIKILATLSALISLLFISDNLWYRVGCIVLALALILWEFWNELPFTKPAGFKKVKYFNNEQEYTLFVYGSLLNPESFLRTIKRKNTYVEYIPACLYGYKRIWGVPTKRSNMIDKNWNSIDNVYWESLVVRTSVHSDRVEGALVSITAKELDEIKLRESNYSLQKTTDAISSIKGKSTEYKNIYTFIPKEDEKVRVDVKKKAIRKGYFDLVNRSLKSLGFKKLKQPKNSNIREAFNADYAAENFWKKNNRLIQEFDSEMESFLRNNKCTRLVGETEQSIPTIIRPIVLSHSMYEEISKISEEILAPFIFSLQFACVIPTERGTSDEGSDSTGLQDPSSLVPRSVGMTRTDCKLLFADFERCPNF